MWTFRGQRSQIPAAGTNEKRCVYGALNYRTGRVHYLVDPRKNAIQFNEFLKQLLQAHAQRRVVLVLDNATYHHTQATLDLLAEHEQHVLVVWLPVYSPELNAIEGLWGYLKRSGLNNYYFGTVNRLERAVDEVFCVLNRNPETALSLAYQCGKNLRETA